MIKSVCVVTLGCKANQFESAAIEELLIQDGYQLVPFEQGAQLVVINTCTVTSATDAQSRKLVRRARRFNPTCRIVVTGCYAQVQPQKLAELDGVDLVIGNMEKENFLSLLNGHGAKVQVGEIAQASHCPNLKIASFFEHSRAFVQIQSGCNAFCSYCIIPFARGRSRSVAVVEVIDQINVLIQNGYQEVVLTGIHIGNYGKDLQGEEGVDVSLATLVETILDQTSLHRLRLGSIEPQELSDELVDLVCQSSRVCSHLHIPLQSGSDAVLKRMNRHYTSEDFYRSLQNIYARSPQISIGIDLIVGFPGETTEEHQQSIDLIDRLPIHYLHVFPYSKRPGTAAEKMKDHVDSAVAKDRATQLRHLGELKKQEYIKSFDGRSVEVVVENSSEKGHCKGLSEEYVPVVFESDLSLAGQCVKVLIGGVDGGGLTGKLI